MTNAARPSDLPTLAPGEEEYNAGNAEHVRAREKKSKERAALAIAGLKFVMSTRQGRAWMRHLLAEKLFVRVGRQVPPAIFTGSSSTFYNTALREMGDRISSELAHHCAEEMHLMEKETDA